MPTCAVAALLPKFDAAVQLFNELDDLQSTPDRGGLTPAALRRRQDAAWRRLRHLEAQAMLETATSERGRALQVILAIPEAFTLRCWAHEQVDAKAAYSRLLGALKSLLAGCDLSAFPKPLVEFYVGSICGRGSDPAPPNSGPLAPPKPRAPSDLHLVQPS